MTPLAIATTRAYIEVGDNEKPLNRALELGKKWKAIVDSWNHPKMDYVWVLVRTRISCIEGPRFPALCTQGTLYVSAAGGLAT